MKNIIRFLICICFSVIAISCSTSTNITVVATPGTEILTPNMNRIAVADGSGKAHLRLSDDYYSSFLLSHAPNSNNYVPFALDYNFNSYPGTKFQKYLGMGLTAIGSFTLVIGAIAGLAVGDFEEFVPLMGVGLGFDAVGMTLGMPADSRSQQTNQQYSYKFLPTQTANQDITVTTPTFNVYSAQTVSQDKRDTTPTSKAKTKSSTSEGTSASSKVLGSSTSSKTLKDNASKIEGTYIGTGSLSQNNSVIESYNGISVTIKKSRKDVVLVNVIESNGEKFFDSDGEYTVKKLSDGKYELSLSNVKTAKITIDTRNNLVYIHPRVNIEGDIYSLSIKAKKQ